MSSQIPYTVQGSYDQLLSWTGHPAAVIKCTIRDIYEASTIRRNHSYGKQRSPLFVIPLIVPVRCSGTNLPSRPVPVSECRYCWVDIELELCAVGEGS
jgi:hypothetical protein